LPELPFDSRSTTLPHHMNPRIAFAEFENEAKGSDFQRSSLDISKNHEEWVWQDQAKNNLFRKSINIEFLFSEPLFGH